jgi:filamentous hemagglutinin family protein
MNKNNNKNGSRVLQGLLLATTAITGSSIIAATAAMASGPSGGTVVIGSATITNPSATQTTITQTSKKALINWNSFSISQGSTVTFNQPNSKSLTVNRVTGPNASAIDGQLLANGSVWLINANGILFGKGSEINVGALIATTSDITDDDFKSGNYSFSKPSSNPNASVTNLGTITTASGGSVVLSAPSVSNQGLIQANLGTVVLGGASTFTVDMTGDNLLRYQISAPVAQAPVDANGNPQSALVTNAGTIIANGGQVLMTARAAQSVQDDVINSTGMVQATSVSSHNGEIDLDAGPNGTVNESGTLNASAAVAGQTGGTVTITGQNVNVADGAKINVSGDTGGGTVEIGGGLHGQGTIPNAQNVTVGNATITADAITKGNGGTVSVWSSGNTSFNGAISSRGGAQGGNGGQVETSGNNLSVGLNAKVDTTAPLGLTGDWLLDPNNIIIQTGSSGGLNGDGTSSCTYCTTTTIDPTTIVNQLHSTNVTLEAGSDIQVLNDIVYSYSNTLSLISGGTIEVDANIKSSGSGDINLVAGWTQVSGASGNDINSALASGDGIPTLFESTPGSYGNSIGNITFGSASGPGVSASVGSLSGSVTVLGHNIVLDGGSSNPTVQIGYQGAGGGAINVFATGDLTLDASNGGSAVIGNGSISTSGATTGNINVEVAGTLRLENDGGTQAWIGNRSAVGETGNVAIVFGSEDDSNGGGLGLIVQTDLDPAAGLGGNVTVGSTGSDSITINSALDYSSSNNLTVLSAGDLGILLGVANSGSGNITLVAGWDGTTLNPQALGTAGTYGHGTGTVTIGGSSAGGSVYVGSAGGTTNVYGYNVDVDAEKGYAQIGYRGASSGGINVQATNEVWVNAGGTLGYTAQIGNGGAGVFGAVGGNIYVESDGDIAVNAAGANSRAVIGNISGTSPDNSNIGLQSGNITVDAYGNNDADYSLDVNASGSASRAQIGNFGVGSGVVGTASGTITVTADGNSTIQTNGANTSRATIGNGSLSNSSAGGSIYVNANNLSVVANAGSSIARIGSQANGNVTSAITVNATQSGDYVGSIDLQGDGASAAAIIGNGASGDAGGVIQVTAASYIDLESEQDASQTRIGNAGLGASGNVTVTAGLQIGMYADGSNSSALISNFTGPNTSGNTDPLSGNIMVESTGSYVDLEANGDGSTARIGNYNGGDTTTVSGNVTVKSDYTHSNQESENGSDIYVEANGDNSFAQIGNGGASQQLISGDVNLSAANIYLTAGYTCTDECEGGPDYPTGAMIQIGNGGNGSVGEMTGDVTVTSDYDLVVDAEGPSDYVQIGNGGYNSSGTTGANINGTTVQSIYGDIDISTEDSGTIQIGNGGSFSNGDSSGSVDVEALNGDINVSTSAPTDESSPDFGEETPAYIQIGNGGEYSNLDPSGGFSTTGDVTVKAQDITLETHNDESNIQMGNGGYCAGAATAACNTSDYTYDSTIGSVSFDGTITVATSDSLTLQTDAYNDSVSIGNGGDNSGAGLSISGDITTAGAIDVTVGEDTANADAAAGTLTMYATSGGDSTVRIGNGGVGTDSNSSATGSVSVGGDITVNVLGGTDDEGSLTHSGSAALTSDGEGASTVVIGNVGGTDDAPYVSGDIGLTVDGDLSFNKGISDSLVIAGNIGQSGYVSGNVTLNAQTIEDVGASVANDIPNGDVTVEVFGTDGVNIDDQNDFYSSYDLTLLSAGDITIGGTLRNLQSSGGGAITLVAGWNGSTTDPALLTTVDGGAYGHNNGSVIVGGETGSSNGSEVADVSGNLTIEGYDVTVEADNGTAQIGYTGDHYGWGNNTGTQTGDGNGDVPGTITVNAAHDVNVTGGSNSDCGCYAQIGNGGVVVIQTDDGPSYIRTDENGGDITVNADGDVTVTGGAGGFSYAQIGNGGDSTSNASGNVTVNAANLYLYGEGDYAQVGNGGDDFIGDASGNINVTVTGAVVVEASQDTPGYGYAQIGNGGASGYNSINGTSGTVTVSAGSVELDGGYASGLYAQIGNGAADGSFEGAVSGDISVTATGSISTTGNSSVAWIGNNADTGGYATSGNVTLIGADVSLNQANLVSDLGGNGATNDNGGDVFIGYTNATGSSNAAIFDGVTYDSGNSLTLAATGDLQITGDVKNSGNGDITLVGGWDAITTDVPTIVANADNEYGNNGATITIGASGDPSVGSAGGTTTIVSDNLTVDATSGDAQIGYNDGENSAGGDINITLTGELSLIGDTGDGYTVQIGNGLYGSNPGGDVTITADSISNTANSDVTGGNVSFDITGPSNAIGTSGQYLDVAANNLAITTQGGDAYINSPDQGLNIGVESVGGIALNGGSLYLTAAGNITQSAAIDANAIDVTTTSSGSITLGDTSNTFGHATISSSGNAAIDDSQSLQVDSASVGNGSTLTLDVDGDLTQGSGAINAGILNATANSGAITFNNGGNTISHATLSAANDISLHDSSALEIDGVVTGSSKTLTLYDTDAGGITQGAANTDNIVAGNLVATDYSGPITLGNTGNSISNATFTAGGNVTLYDIAALTVQKASVGGNTLTLTDTNAGGIGQSNSIQAGSLVATDNSGALTFANTGNQIAAVKFSAGDDVTFDDSTRFEVDGASLAGHTLTLFEGGMNAGNITQGSNASDAIVAANLIVTANAFTDATFGVNVILDNASNSVGTATFTASGNVTLDDSIALMLNSASLSGSHISNYALTLADSGGSITQGSGAITANSVNATTNASGAAITLTNMGNSFGALTLAAAGNASTYDTAALTINGASVGSGKTLTITDNNTGGISQGSGNGNKITASNLVITDSSGAITLNNVSNAIGTASITAGGSATLDDSVALQILGATVGSSASLTLYETGGNITQAAATTNAISAAVLNVTDTSGAVTLNNTHNAVGALILSATGDSTFDDTIALVLDGIIDTGHAFTVIDTGGAITEASGSSQAIIAGSLNATAASFAITLGNASNAVGAASFTAGSDVAFNDSTSFELDGASLAGHTLSLTDTGGAISQGSAMSNAIKASTLLTTTSGSSGAITLINASNAVGTASFSATDDASFYDTAALTLNGASLAGHTLMLTDTSTGGITEGAGPSNAIVAGSLVATDNSGALTFANTSNAVGAVTFAAGGNVTFDDSTGFEVDGASLAGYTLTLDPVVTAPITQGSSSSDAIIANAIIATNQSGGITLGNTYNSVGVATFSAAGDVTFYDTVALTLNGATLSGYTLTLTDTASGGIGQGSGGTNAIVAGALNATSTNGNTTLTNTSNAVSGASFSGSGNVNFYDTSALEIDGASLAGQTLTLTVASGDITQGSGPGITANAINMTALSGAVTLDNGNNAISHETISATTDATLDDSTAVEIDGVTVGNGNTFTIADTGGNVTQGSGSTNAITAPAVNVTASSGSISLNNSNNAISSAALASSGNSTLYDSRDLTVTGVSDGGNLTLLTTGNLTFTGSAQLSNGTLLAVAGWDGTTTSPSSLTTVNAYGNNSGSITVGGVNAASDVAVGSNSGTTTLAGNNITLDAENGYSQLGYHGTGGGDIYAYAKGNIVVQSTAGADYALLGNGTGGLDVSGNETGNIYLLAGGDIQLNSAGASPWIGNHIGSSGTESGNLTVVAQDENDNCGIAQCEFDFGEMVESALGSTINTGSGGNVAVAFTNPENNGSPVMTITDGFNYNSPHDLTVISGNSLYVDNAIQNAGSGNITLISGWNSSAVTGQNIIGAVQDNTTVSSLFSSKGSYGQTNNGDTNKGSIEIGCDASDTTCSSNTAAVGSASGITTVLTNNLALTAGAGLGAQLGYDFSGAAASSASGAINVTAQGNIALTGGSVLSSYAQIGDGGYKATGNTSDNIIVNAGGIVQLDGGTGQEAYAQIGNGGAESNSNITGSYTDTGLITVTGQSVVLQAGAIPTTTTTPAGTLSAAYAQIGNGGYKSGQNLNGTATIGGNINVTVTPPNGTAGVALLGNGTDAYAQIGNGGDEVNYQWTGSSSGTINGDIQVIISPAKNNTDAIQMVGGSANNAYAQIGNGGNGENTPLSGSTSSVPFNVSGAITVVDLKLWGGNGTNDYGQIGNGDNAGTGYGNVSGGINIGGTDFNFKNGNGSGDAASIGNNTGFGTISNSISGYPPPSTGPGAGTQGAISSTTQIPTIPTGFDITTVIITPGPGSSSSNDNGSGGSTPLEQIADGNGEGSQDSDGAADSLGNSLNGHKTSTFTRIIIPGVLTQIVTLGSRNPNGVPPPDVDYSSWGNEALWRW